MPLSRYQLRNEYSLADPDLYRAADKDDPEALLEGVAMAGLVGVLRQLGDLAEFAAEIFHDLHEEVMATASRGHSLMVRVQQLEAEVPRIEKAFLSQTIHSSFYYNAGMDWHPNTHMDQNLITRGDLPRFIMDSYEECRGPPRLFLLDKFDVAGAGACLKRYTDPSVFKVEASYSGITSADVLREKKARKAKKKGSRWRNGETPESLPTSHAKLHQLFMEERIENGTIDSARRVKLKRRLNGFPFDIRSGKSYMEKFLRSPSPEHEEVHEIPVDSSPLALPYNNVYESAFEIVEISTVSPEKESKQTMSSPSSSSSTGKGTTPASAIHELNEVPCPSPNGISEVSKSKSAVEANYISSTLHKGLTAMEVSVDGGIKKEESGGDYQSDDAASEIENYMDALATMDSEMDTDSELRSKNDLLNLNSRRQASNSDMDGEQVHAHFSDSLSMGNSSLSDEGNSSSKKDLSSFSYSDSHSTSAENTPSEGEVSSNTFTSTEIHASEDLPTQQSIGGGHVSQPLGGAASDGSFTEPVEIPGNSSEPGDLTAPSDSAPVDKNEEAVVKQIASMGPEIDEMVPKLSMDPPLISSDDWLQEGDYSSQQMSGDNQHLDEFENENVNKAKNLGNSSEPGDLAAPSDSAPVDENEAAVVKQIASMGPEIDEMVPKLSMDPPLISSDDWLQEGDYSSRQMSGDNQHLDEFENENVNKAKNLGCTSHLPVQSISRDGYLFEVSAENKFDDKLEDEDRNQQDDLASTADCLVAHHAMDDNPFLLSSETQPLDKLHDEDGPNSRDDSSNAFNPLDAVLQNRDDLSPKMSYEKLRLDDSGVENPNFVLDAPVFASDTIDAATEKKITENLLENVPQSGDPQDNLVADSVENQIGPQNLVMTLTGEQSIDAISMEVETHCSKVEPVDRDSEIDDAVPSAGGKADNLIFKEDIPVICESLESFVSGTIGEIPPLGLSEERTSYLREEYFDQPSNLGDGAVMDKATSDPDLVEMDTTSEPSLMAGDDVHLDEIAREPLNVPATFSSHDNHAVEDDDDGSSVDPKKFHEGPLPGIGNEHNGLETEAFWLDTPGKSDIAEDVCHQKYASPDLNSLCNIVTDEDTGSQACDDASDTYIVSEARSSLNPGDAPTCQSSVEQNEQELHLKEKFDIQVQEYEQKLFSEGQANSELFNQLQQKHYSNQDDQVGASDTFAESLLVNIPSQLSTSKLLPQGNNMIEVSEHLLDPSSSIALGSSLLSNSSQIYVEEMPPLPPLPPVQWRMGKLQYANQTLERMSAERTATAFPPPLQCISDQEAQPLVPFSPPSASACEMSMPMSEELITITNPFLSQVQAVVHDGDSKDDVLPQEVIGCTSTSLQLPESHGGMLQNDCQAGEGEKVPTTLDSSHASVMDAASADALELSHQEVVKPLNEMAPEKSLKDMELCQHSAYSDDNVMTCSTTELPSDVANKHAMPTSEEKLSWPTSEDGKLHGVQPMKLPRPRNPLIDAVAAHDKSKLRKVTERFRPQIQKEDERDSLLEQIRAKSFNLKPAVVTRPSIQGPKTNLKVAAILEKAKTIRQAFAGSDEDDDDSWSDS
ncbi:protein SCAR2 isoform X1 [Coffea arabica]|uniref:Protein SCAR n=1 Tax=Coffea arabica TaxID=13443 RepID=A0A6P6SIZ9_COFAR|nr:protein SCAR2-like [Coffea arabica]